MKLTEMHVWFRQYAQQMGMQNVRAILPEQIDLLINTSISDIVNQLIRENISVTNDRIITDNSKLGQINIFRTLYNVKIIELCPTPKTNKEYRAFHFNSKDRNTGKLSTMFTRIPTYGTDVKDKNHFETNIPDNLFIVDFSINYRKVKDGKGFTGKNGTGYKFDLTNYNNRVIGSKHTNFTDDDLIDVLIQPESDDDETFRAKAKFSTTSIGHCIQVVECNDNDDYVGFVLGYNQDYQYGYMLVDDSEDVFPVNTTNPITNIRTFNKDLPAEFSEDSLETNFFPVRLIDDIYLADTLNDFILKPRFRSPIMVVYNHNEKEQVMDLYIDKFNKVNDRYVLQNNLVPYQLRMSYIAKPAKVEYREDYGGTNIECDLPESIHIDILKHAVDLYRVATSGALHANQGQNGQQEAPNNSQQ